MSKPRKKKKTASGKPAGSTSKTATKASAPVARRKASSPDPFDQFIDAAAVAIDLPVEPAWKPAVKANLEVTLQLARLFGDVLLPDDAEPAPVFVA